MEGAIKKLFFFEKREVLAVITETMMLSQYTLGSEGEAQEYMKVFNTILSMKVLIHPSHINPLRSGKESAGPLKATGRCFASHPKLFLSSEVFQSNFYLYESCSKSLNVYMYIRVDF